MGNTGAHHFGSLQRRKLATGGRLGAVGERAAFTRHAALRCAFDRIRFLNPFPEDSSMAEANTKATAASVAAHLAGLQDPAQQALRARLGKHKMDKACLYLRRLADVDAQELERLIAGSVAEVRPTNTPASASTTVTSSIGRPSRPRSKRPGAAVPAPPHQLGATAQAGLRHRHAALLELRQRGAQDHRGHPRTAGDRARRGKPEAGLGGKGAVWSSHPPIRHPPSARP